MRIALASDHAGFGLKQNIAARLAALGHDVHDLGTHGTESVDYPEFGFAVAHAVTSGAAECGVLVCGSGIGVSIAANRVAGARAARCTSEFDARLARQHNDANILCLGSRVTGPGLAESILDAFLGAGFDGGRHARRVAMMDENEPGRPVRPAK